jgi:hypothetical protein
MHSERQGCTYQGTVCAVALNPAADSYTLHQTTTCIYNVSSSDDCADSVTANNPPFFSIIYAAIAAVCCKPWVQSSIVRCIRATLQLTLSLLLETAAGHV